MDISYNTEVSRNIRSIPLSTMLGVEVQIASEVIDTLSTNTEYLALVGD